MPAAAAAVQYSCRDDNVVIPAGGLRLWEGRPMTDRRVRWTTLALLILAGALATPAQGASPSFSSSFEPADPQPTWTDTAERAQGVTGPDRPGIPGNVTDTVVAMKARGENAPRRGQGEPRRRLLRQQVAGLQPHELGRARARRAGEGRPLRAHLGQRRAGPRPARLDAPGLHRRHDVDHARHPLRRVVLRPLPDEDLRLRQRHRLQVLPARHHGQPRRRHHPARRAAALDRAGEPAAARP